MRAEKARRSLAEFARQAWHVIEPGSPYVHGWHIDAICEHLEAVSRGEIRNLLINMPPRHAKSTLVAVLWPAWEWITSPHTQWLYASYAASLSIRDSVKCRRLIMSPWYQECFGDRFKVVGDQNEKIRFENDKTGYRLSTSVGGSATGEGGSRIVCDDPHNVLEAESKTIRETTLEWWDNVMSTRGNDPKTVGRVIVMQRVHARDLAGHVLNQGGYEHLCLPAEYEGEKSITGIGWEDPRKKAGELLWPERFGTPELAEIKKRLGSRAASAQLQQKPSLSEGELLKRSWWKFYRALPGRTDQWLISVDAAFKGNNENDYVVMQCWAKAGADRFLVDQVRARMDFPTTVQSISNFCAKYPQAGTKIVEDKANGPAIIATLKSRIPGIIPYSPEVSKVARVQAVSPQIEAGNVYLPENAQWVSDLIEECAQFPKGANDDCVDAMSQALIRMESQNVGEFSDDLLQTQNYQTIAGGTGRKEAW